MPLSPGSRLGPYEIVAPIGAGGMGEVYRARDSRLGREVAIKRIPGELAGDRARLERFETEARAAAALNHPGICRLYDVGHDDGAPYLVMELLEGETLRDRLRRGPLHERQAITFGADVAHALAAAHEKGIVHRDLKPENLQLGRDGHAKVLDFGLAKLRPPLPGGVLSLVDTEAAGPTEAGALLGTIGYMAPEQVRGEAADVRADIFALGVVLAEALSGSPVFAGRSFVEVGNAILNAEPRLERAGGPPLSAPMRRVLERCMAKRPEDRFQSAADLAFALEALPGAGVPATAAPSAGLARWISAAWVIAALALGFVASMLLGLGRDTKPPAPMTHFRMPPPAGTVFNFKLEEDVCFAVSPDGTRLAFVASDSGGARAWIRTFAERDPEPVQGSAGAMSVFWSPDGRSIGFATARELKRRDLAGGGVVTICPLPASTRFSASWGSRGRIVLGATAEGVLYEVPASGGTPRRLPLPRPSDAVARSVWPEFLPDGERFLFLLHRAAQRDSLLVGDLQGRYRVVGPASSRAMLAGPRALLHVSQGTLLLQPLDGSLRFAGAPTPLASDVTAFPSSGGALFSVSPAGVLAYDQVIERAHIAWIDSRGEETGRVGSDADYLGDLSLSHDGRRLLVSRRDRTLQTWDVWSLDLERGTESQVTSDVATEAFGTWLPGDRALVLGTTMLGSPPRLARLDLDSGRLEPPASAGGFQVPFDVSRDGRWLIHGEQQSPAPFQLFVRELPNGAPRQLRADPAGVGDASFSPDGRAIAFDSHEGDRFELFVTPFPGPGERLRVSRQGVSICGRWSPDGRWLYFLQPDGRFMSVSVTTSPLRVGRPEVLFTTHGKPWRDFVVAPDGRFLAVLPDLVREEEPIDVITGWRPPR